MAAFVALQAEDPQRAGPYRLVARLGMGGLGRTFLGRPAVAGKPVAVKVVREELGEDDAFRRRLAREFAEARGVSGTFNVGVAEADPEGSPAWLATAYVRGVALDAAVPEDGAWPLQAVRALAAALVAALEGVHGAGVVHGNLKPSNVLLSPDGPRLVDGGITVPHPVDAPRTAADVGAAGFVPPERVAGRPVGPAGDVFSLGALLVFAATGRGPFGTGPAHLLRSRVVDEAPDLGGLPSGLIALAARCLAKKPEHRPTLEELAGELPDASGAAGTGWLPEAVAGTVRERAAAVLPSGKPPVKRPVPKPRTVTAPPPSPGSGPGTGTSTLPDDEPTRRSALLGLISTGVALFTVFGSARSCGTSSGSPSTPYTGVPWFDESHSPGPFSSLLAQMWEVYSGTGKLSPPAAANGRLYAVSDRTLYAIEPYTAFSGRPAWTFLIGYNPLVAAPAAADGTVYVGGGDHRLYAVDARTGRRRWVFTAGGDVWSTPVAGGGTVYALGEDGRLYAVDARTGRQRWVFTAGGTTDSIRPALAGGAVYAGFGGRLYAVDARTGRRRWTFDVGDQARSAPAVADGIVYLGGGPRLYALDAATGRRRWVFTADGSTVSSPAVADGTVFVGTGHGGLYAVDAVTGRRRWAFTGAPQMRTPVTLGTKVYSAGSDGSVYSVNAVTGVRMMAYPIGDTGSQPGTVLNGAVFFASGHSLYKLPF